MFSIVVYLKLGSQLTFLFTFYLTAIFIDIVIDILTVIFIDILIDILTDIFVDILIDILTDIFIDISIDKEEGGWGREWTFPPAYGMLIKKAKCFPLSLGLQDIRFPCAPGPNNRQCSSLSFGFL